MSDKLDKQPWPDNEPPPDDAELQAARQLGQALDQVLADERGADGDDLLSAAVMARASHKGQRLHRQRRDELVQQALAVAPARSRRLVWRAAPVVALAASVVLVLSVLIGKGTPDRAPAPAATAPASTLSRSSDALMGRPFTDRAGASARMDRVFADRLRGYRQVLLADKGAP